MSRGLFNWTAEEVVRFVKEYGFMHSYSRGSHQFYVGNYKGTFCQVCVPFHGSRAIKPRTLKSIILQSGIPKEKWVE